LVGQFSDLVGGFRGLVGQFGDLVGHFQFQLWFDATFELKGIKEAIRWSGWQIGS